MTDAADANAAPEGAELSINDAAALQAVLAARDGGLAGLFRAAGVPIGDDFAARLSLVESEAGEAGAGAFKDGAFKDGAFKDRDVGEGVEPPLHTWEESCWAAERAMADDMRARVGPSDTPDTMLSLLSALKATETPEAGNESAQDAGRTGPAGLSVW